MQEKQREIKRLQEIEWLHKQQYERAEKFRKEQEELERLQEVHRQKEERVNSELAGKFRKVQEEEQKLKEQQELLHLNSIKQQEIERELATQLEGWKREKNKLEKEQRERKQTLDAREKSLQHQQQKLAKEFEDWKGEMEKKEREALKGLQVPPYWKNKDMHSPWQNVEKIVLTDGREKDAVVAAFLNGKSTNQNLEVLQVERVQNITVWSSYAGRRHAMMQRQGATDNYERVWLFHGTDENTVHKIVSQGFNRNFGFREINKNALTMYGKGVYFAVNSSYSSSHRYSKPNSAREQRMFACRVLVGEYCQGKPDEPTPDERHERELYDSTVDNVNTPEIFVAPHDAQAYPEYLITFKAH